MPGPLVRTALAVTGAGTAVAIGSRINNSTLRLRESPSQNASRIAPDKDGITRTDVLIVGSGGAALTASLRAKSIGLTTLVVEKSSKIGGTSCFSGSGCWIPNTHIHANSGTGDSVPEALKYMESIIGDAGPASSRERKLSFLENGPKMVKWLEGQGYRWTQTPKYPDYFPYNPGARIGGRTIEAGMWDINLLGEEWRDKLNINPVRPPLPLFTFELAKIVRAKCSWDGMWCAAKIFGVRPYSWRVLFGSEPTTLGVSMISQLIYLNVKAGVPIWTETSMEELIVNPATGRVEGAKVVDKEGKVQLIHAKNGVIIAAGGFARNLELRQQHQHPTLSSDKWTSTCATDTGGPISAAIKIGAATALMDSAWWGAALFDPRKNQGIWSLYDRGCPHSIIVDAQGERFANESQNYNSLGTKIWERQETGKDTIPAWLVLDSKHRSRYLLAGRFMPGKAIPKEDLDSGFIVMADTIKELAGKTGIDENGLEKTVERFNGFVEKGVDEDFRRGESVYDKYLGDPGYGKNRNLGKVEKGPFYAVKIWPGDLGTKGGVLTNEVGQALREKKQLGSDAMGRSGGGWNGLWESGGKKGDNVNGKNPGIKGEDGTEYEVIPGLYAAGNSSASVMGRTYAGAGATLGPGLTFGWIAATKCAEDAGIGRTKA